MSHVTSTILLWLFVINLDIAFGAGLYEHRIVVPGWISSDDGQAHWNAGTVRRDNTGLRFWAYVTTGPLTLLTLANLTFSYFIPTMVGLMNAADSPASVAVGTRWASLNYLRHALVLGGWLAALRAFSLIYGSHAS